MTKSEVFLDDPNTIELANISPELILEGEKTRLISDWQEATSLWDAIRYEIDKAGGKGQYILTESSVPDKTKTNHSGAGRVGKLQMRTMSLFETRGFFWNGIFEGYL